MTIPAITVEHVGKLYRLGATNARSVRELVNGFAARLSGRGNHRADTALAGERLDERGRFRALEDVSFEIHSGEVVGIIGRNGAGKSTLLKILSRITAPTSGRITIRGRVASLLEVGTGFHPELSGRENLYLNGALLGMTRAEVRRQFEEIVEFAGVGPFIDTPVKRYSSGMTVRLGFAVAAHLEPEILIVDEVLAVGDVEFQKKCLGKMRDVSASGRTVLFVSHNMASIRALTKRSILLSRGRLTADGATESVIERYMDENLGHVRANGNVRNLPRAFGGLINGLRFEELRFVEDDPPGSAGRKLIEIRGRASEAIPSYVIGVSVFRYDGQPVGTGFSEPVGGVDAASQATCRLELPVEQLAPGRYHCAISYCESRSGLTRHYDSLSEVLPFEVHQEPFSGPPWHDGWGLIKLGALRVHEPPAIEGVR
jgi:lipopolysaccharide transport system ATP-binding protein